MMARSASSPHSPDRAKVALPDKERSEAAYVRRGLRLAYEYGVVCVLLAAFALSGFVLSLAATLLRTLLPRTRSQIAGQWLIMAGCRTLVAMMRASGLIKCDLSEIDALRSEPPLVIAPNHPSLIDAVLVLSRLPGVICTTKPEVWRNPCLGALVRAAGYVPNHGPLSLVKQATDQLRAGRHVLMFPEGTRSNGGTIGPFKGGFALAARRSQTVVQTAFIETNSRFLGKGWPLFKKPEFPLVYRVRLGRPFVVDGPVRDFLPRLREYYRQELAAPHQ
jgi:1-acyl-sn-glycerol-3-phosphate acyltransferase